MKPIKFLVSLALLSSTSLSFGLILFSDNFDVNTPSELEDANGGPGPSHQNTNPGRQGGNVGVLNYTKRNNVQVGNINTLSPSPGSSLGDEMLLAFDAGSFIDHNFSAVTAPLEILFSGLISSRENRETDPLTTWIGLMVGDLSDRSFVTDTDAGILFRANGNTQVFSDGNAAPTSGASAAPGLDVWSNYKVVLSDTAGTGSAFGTGGSRADYYMNGILLGTAVFDQLTAAQGYIGFSVGTWIGGVDNVQISVIPESSTWVASITGLAGLALVRRRK